MHLGRRRRRSGNPEAQRTVLRAGDGTGPKRGRVSTDAFRSRSLSARQREATALRLTGTIIPWKKRIFTEKKLRKQQKNVGQAENDTFFAVCPHGYLLPVFPGGKGLAFFCTPVFSGEKEFVFFCSGRSRKKTPRASRESFCFVPRKRIAR